VSLAPENKSSTRPRIECGLTDTDLLVTVKRSIFRNLQGESVYDC